MYYVITILEKIL